MISSPGISQAGFLRQFSPSPRLPVSPSPRLPVSPSPLGRDAVAKAAPH
ncbi:MAG TPA: hypothetical protein IGS52_18990 [Oscillatoriaceae cyanobacterium M33_DOE_052]|nr:hypothetical protein [Oscillatoriaceae cyanobacterium M33_DOE_052]